MTTRIADILTKVRDSLSDSTGDRWSDDRLLRLIDEAQKDLCKKSLLLRDKVTKSLYAGVSTYEMPENAIHTLRFTDSDGNFIPVKTHEQMDILDPGWEVVTGETVKYIVYDKLKPRYFKVYPIPELDDGPADSFITSDYGVVATSEGDAVDDYGVVATISSTSLEPTSFDSDYGVLVGMTSEFQSLIIYYYRYSVDINAIDIAPSVLEIDHIYDKAIKHYVVSEALRDDKDTQDMTVSRDHKKDYTDEREDARVDSGKDFTRASRRETQYNNGFN